MNDNIEKVSIAIGPTMYGRFEDLTNTPSNVLAEFVDNALQSYRDNRQRLHALSPGYRFMVSIDFVPDETNGGYREIKISDNAAGISRNRYTKAFMPAEKPEDNTGLNEFGMGFKTAACWLGDVWSVCTKALGDTDERTLRFDQLEVIEGGLKVLPVTHAERPAAEHYTTFTITKLTKNAPQKTDRIKTNLASVYRQSLQSGEMRLVVDGEELVFRAPEILEAPFYKDPDSKPLYWRKDIDFQLGQYEARGYIGILKNMNSRDNGFVLLRRGRVVKGAEDGGRYFPKSLCGTVGSPRYKRLFGELELEGFKVSFNKNDILDSENLDALMEGLKGEIHTKEFDLYAQAEGYRLDERRRQAAKLVKKHNTAPKRDKASIELHTKPGASPMPTSLFPEQADSADKPKRKPTVLDEYNDSYIIDGVKYQLRVQFVDHGTDLFWVDVSRESENIIICQINTGHVFFEHFGKPDDATVAILKTTAIAKFTAKKSADNDAVKMMEFFNEFIKRTKV